MKNSRFALNLAVVVAGMFLLAFASVPLYRLFCQVTGYGGTTQTAAHAPGKVSERRITIEFNADIDPGLNWEFTPGERKRSVAIGEEGLTHYVAHNREGKTTMGRAVYNVVPFKAGPYFVKVACFCFSEQKLGPNQRVDMPVSFYLDPALLNDPEMDDVHTITLSYTFFPVEKGK